MIPSLFSTLELSVESNPEHFSSDGVSVTLEWTLLNSQVYYQQLLQNIIINTDPPVDNIMFTGSMSVQLTLSYNTQYSVSITQNSTCERLIRHTFLELNYSKLYIHHSFNKYSMNLLLQTSVLTRWN